MQLGGRGLRVVESRPAPKLLHVPFRAAANIDISDQAEADFPADGGQISLDAAIQSGVGYLTVTDGFGSGTTTRVSANQWYAVPSAVPPGPTVSIQETDTGGMVFEGDAATFDIHVDAGTSEPTSPLTVDYRTMDGSVRPRRIINRPTGRCR